MASDADSCSRTLIGSSRGIEEGSFAEVGLRWRPFGIDSRQVVG